MDLVGAEWRKSSFSGTEGDCVEVAFVPGTLGPDTVDPGTVGVRDTKARTSGTLAFPRSSWTTFTRSTAD